MKEAYCQICGVAFNRANDPSNDPTIAAGDRVESYSRETTIGTLIVCTHCDDRHEDFVDASLEGDEQTLADIRADSREAWEDSDLNVHFGSED